MQPRSAQIIPPITAGKRYAIALIIQFAAHHSNRKLVGKLTEVIATDVEVYAAALAEYAVAQISQVIGKQPVVDDIAVVLYNDAGVDETSAPCGKHIVLYEQGRAFFGKDTIRYAACCRYIEGTAGNARKGIAENGYALQVVFKEAEVNLNPIEHRSRVIADGTNAGAEVVEVGAEYFKIR